jgi:hypothetical protein
MFSRLSLALLTSLSAAPLAYAQAAPITVAVDLSDAPRKILHSTETIPV